MEVGSCMHVSETHSAVPFQDLQCYLGPLIALSGIACEREGN